MCYLSTRLDIDLDACNPAREGKTFDIFCLQGGKKSQETSFAHLCDEMSLIYWYWCIHDEQYEFYKKNIIR